MAIVEDLYLGGTCVNVGCVPKKLYAYAAHFHSAFDGRQRLWLATARGGAFRLGHAEGQQKQAKSSVLTVIYQRLLETAGVNLYNGRGSLVDAHTVRIRSKQGDEQRVSAERILLATGGWPWVPSFPGSEYALDSNQIFDLDRLPERFLVLGGGYIAVEFASIFKRPGQRGASYLPW